MIVNEELSGSLWAAACLWPRVPEVLEASHVGMCKVLYGYLVHSQIGTCVLLCVHIQLCTARGSTALLVLRDVIESRKRRLKSSVK